MTTLAHPIVSTKTVDIATFLRCQQFALDTVTTHVQHYAGRGQSIISKIITDIAMGKLAEVAVWSYLNDCGLNSIPPDFNVLKGKRKSYDADISCNGMSVHVKSMNKYRATKYGISFMFQKNDPLVINPSHSDQICCCLVDNLTVTILALINPRIVNWRTPEKVALQHTKVCLHI